jgi:hypothetical protein
MKMKLRWVALSTATCFVLFRLFVQHGWANALFVAGCFGLLVLCVEGPATVAQWWRGEWDCLDRAELEALREINSRQGRWS